MGQSIKSLKIKEFWQKFPDFNACMAYLASLKWRDGFSCQNCGHNYSCKGYSPMIDSVPVADAYIRQPVTPCFIKSSLAFKMHFTLVYVMSTDKKGTTSTKMSRDVGIRQPTCWCFMKKVRKAMSISKICPVQGNIEKDEMALGGEETGTGGRNNHKKKLAVVGIEKKGKGVGRLYCPCIEDSNTKVLVAFFQDLLDNEVSVRTGGWTGYMPIKKQYPNMKREYSSPKRSNFKVMHRCIMKFKAWLRGIHHHVEDLQANFDEYSYRFKRHFIGSNILENLMRRMVHNGPYMIKNFNIC